MVESRTLGGCGKNSTRPARSSPRALKRNTFSATYGTTEELAEKVPFLASGVTPAAKAGTENKLVVAAVNRCATQNQARHCATQNQVRHRVFHQPVKPLRNQIGRAHV